MSTRAEVGLTNASSAGNAPSAGVPFLKGHGTENDFVLLPDPSGLLQISEAQVRAVCDRHAGIGADGIVHIAPGADGAFFMDYRNADGSLAEMCGNGARVFARFLVDNRWLPAGEFSFGTRGGTRRAIVPDAGDVTISMGPVTLGVASRVRASLLSGQNLEFPGTAVDVGNPHLVAITDWDITQLDLTRAPSYDQQVFPSGVNIEFVNIRGVDAVQMRVFERGVGETRACGTGTVAVAVAYLAASGRTEGLIVVGVLGGQVHVRIEAGEAYLTGPAVIMSSGFIDREWWDLHR
ncbi:diaminopimelate epimerase [Nakamurella antarctica]|uniref:Diaminopimelate epimerase n=1 Tax=Nakamurella antarctica TaxID=1902245 RepID=A0A3G8ZKC9_9ACTN|nr:diaminopimelate epimerase [Nakamurella antarctica]AZI57648.1 diaminopimelate epimerase [Nakamurella antarctica]